MLVQIDVSQYDMFYIREKIIPWVREIYKNNYAYMWPGKRFIFYDNGDATIFILKFGGKRIETNIEKMYRNLKDDE